MDNLADFEKAYETIMSSDADTETKDQQLAALMTKMEIVFKIPLMRNREWEKRHPDAITLYRKISNSRSL
jgi:hypothetical protein